MTLDELFEEIERSEEDAIKEQKINADLKDWEGEAYHEGKSIAFRICLEKLRKYRLSSGAE